MAGPADRRASERMAVNRGTACAYVGRVIDDIGAVKIRDVSLEGIGLVIMKSVPAGSMLVIGLSNPDKGFIKTVIVEVAHVTPITGGVSGRRHLHRSTDIPRADHTRHVAPPVLGEPVAFRGSV